MPIGPFVKVPDSVKKDQVFTVKAKLKHPMETGWRENKNGEKIPRKRIHKFVCTFNGKEMFWADLHSGISADPYLTFPAKLSESGLLKLTWLEDGGREYVTEKMVSVT